MGRMAPGCRVNRSSIQGEVVRPVQIPAQLLRGNTSVIFDSVRVKGCLATGAGTLSTSNARRLVAGATRISPTMERPKHRTSAINVFHHVPFPNASQTPPLLRVPPDIQVAGP